jgi:hypothetical protein
MGTALCRHQKLTILPDLGGQDSDPGPRSKARKTSDAVKVMTARDVAELRTLREMAKVKASNDHDAYELRPLKNAEATYKILQNFKKKCHIIEGSPLHDAGWNVIDEWDTIGQKGYGKWRHFRRMKGVAVDENAYLVKLDVGSLLGETRQLDLKGFHTIVHLDLSRNSIKGNLPVKALRQMVVAKAIRLFDNCLTGEIPWDTFLLLVQYHCLRELVLNHNPFKASKFPQQIGYMKKIERLGLSNINLSGTVPRSLDDMRSLTNFDISANKFSGDDEFMPEELFSKPDLMYVGSYCQLIC